MGLILAMTYPAAARKRPPAPLPPASGGVVDHANGYTLDEKGALHRFSALLIGDDGTVKQLFAPGEEPPANVRFRLNAGGRTLIPGLVQGQAHIVHLGLSKLLETTTEPRAIERIKAGLANGGEGILPRERDAAVLAGQAALLTQGFTSAVDMETSVEDWLSMRRIGDAGQLRVRIISYAAGINATLAIGGPAPSGGLYGDRLRIVGMTMDGGKANQPDTPAYTDTQLRNIMSRAAMDGFQVSVTARGETVRKQAMDAYLELSDTYKGDRRWRIERPAGSATDDMAAYRTISGLEILPTPELKDGPGKFGLMTLHPAEAAFADKRVGSLQPGHRADFLLIDRDIFAHPEEAAGVQVIESWVGGERAWVRDQAGSPIRRDGVNTCGNTSGDCAPGR